MAYTYSGVSGATASAILPFGYWNAFVANNASSFHEGITAVSAGLTGLSGAYTAHSAQPSGVHGMRANAGPVGSLSGSGFVVQSATAVFPSAAGVWVVWPQPFLAAPVIVACLEQVASPPGEMPYIVSNQLGSALMSGREPDNASTAHLLAFGRV